MTPVAWVLALVALVALVAASRTDVSHPQRAAVPRFGGATTAWSLRARRSSMPLGHWALRGWLRTPLRLGARAPGSVLVVGPTQSGKTSALCCPLVAGWRGPVLAASVKGDLVASTEAARRLLGTVQVVAPGVEGSSVWDPVAQARSFEEARALAAALTVGTGAGSSQADQEFWASLAAKLLAPMLLAANLAGGTIATVSTWLDRRDVDGALEHLVGLPEVADALVASFTRDDRTLGSVIATLEAALEPLCAGDDVVDPAALLEGPNTCFLCAPMHDQRRFRPLFSGLLRQVLAAAAVSSERGAPSGLLVLLDEAASIAPVEELDQIAATCQGQGVTLVTVWQDLAQLTARYGAKSRTVVNNHTTRVLLGGLADPTLDEWLPTLTGSSRAARGDGSVATLRSDDVRQWPKGAALLVAGRHAPVRLRLEHPRRSSRAPSAPGHYAS
jgi:type IV secretory pathway TraG/TraD family ATPase VirD4